MRYLTIVMICLLMSCQEREKDRFPASGSAEFHTTPPSRYYFKNLRSLQYASSELRGSRAEIFQPKGMVRQVKEGELLPSIADHWLEEEAYLLLLPYPPSWSGEPVRIEWQTENEGLQQIGLENLAPREHLRAFRQILGALKKGHRIVRKQDGRELPLWDGQDPLPAFQSVYADFKRLTESNGAETAR